MRLSLIISFLFFAIFSANATIIQVSGEVSGNWEADTVQVIDHITIPDNQSLTIKPGVKVIFDGYFRFNVIGHIQALGSEGDSISFYVSDTTGLYSLENTKGAWAGFWFEPLSATSDSSIFEYCKFSYGKAVSVDTNYWHGGAVSIWKYSNLRFSKCKFNNNIARKNGGAIYCNASNIRIEKCTFIDNLGGNDIEWGYGGAVCLEYSNAVIYRNHFESNSSTGVGGGLSFEYSDPMIESNVFYDNYSAIGGALCALRSELGNPIVNNLIYNNSTLFFGGGVGFLGAQSLFTNNTVENNYSMYGGAMQINTGSSPVITNNIIRNNMSNSPEGNQIWVYDVNSGPKFSYNNIQGGYEDFGGSGTDDFSGIYENNIDEDPIYTEEGEFNYMLSENSPCINAGSPDTTGLSLPIYDLAMKMRFKDDRIDMGCYEFQGNSNTHQISFENNDLNVSPNPIGNIAVFQINTSKLTSKAELRIIDTNGKQIRSFKINQQENIIWDAKDASGAKLPAGVYLYQITDLSSVITKKLILK
jgi:predicted outer membrane repeat protein